MFKKSSDSVQFNLYASPESLFSSKSLKLYEDKTTWNNLLRQQVPRRNNESPFSPLFCENNGTPNVPELVLVATMVLKEVGGLSDQKLFENYRFNMLASSAIGLLNVDDSVPSDSIYCLFRKRINAYARASKNVTSKLESIVT
jgi:hypothetical protein